MEAATHCIPLTTSDLLSIRPNDCKQTIRVRRYCSDTNSVNSHPIQHYQPGKIQRRWWYELTGTS